MLQELNNERARKEIRGLIAAGVWCPRRIFNTVYSTYTGHYNTLRRMIDEEKNK